MLILALDEYQWKVVNLAAEEKKYENEETGMEAKYMKDGNEEENEARKRRRKLVNDPRHPLCRYGKDCYRHTPNKSITD